MRPYEKPIRKIIFSTVCILLGNALLAFLVAAFVIPHNIIMGGTTGIGIVLNRLFPQVEVSVYVLVLNVLLLLAGWRILGRQFALTTIASTFLYPVFLGAIQRIPGIESLTGNSLTAALFAGTLMGVALGLVMRVGSSTGGMDVVDMVLAHWTHLPVALFVWLGDLVVIGGQAFFSPAENTLLGIIVLVLESIVLDKVMLVGKAQSQVFVISKRYEAIREMVMNELSAGCTMVEIETGRLRIPAKGVLCVIPQRKVYDVTERIRALDPESFMTISQINEVHGRGFTTEREMRDEVPAGQDYSA
ncbi:MAG: YitT family protein [Lachnospiraceae bacterium]|nr:YitT family protein [Lachnospiraceae bacterium]